MTPPIYTNVGNKIFSKDTETSRGGNEWIFDVKIRSLSEKFENLELYLEIFSNNKPYVVCSSEAWISNVNELQMLHLDIYLPPIFHSEFNRSDDIVLYVH